jgi:hypothetical protein
VSHTEQRAEDVSINGGRLALGALFSHRTRLALGAGVVDGEIKAIETRDGFVETRSRISSS